MAEKKSLVAAADVGGTTVKLGFFLQDGSLYKKWEIKTDTSDKGKNILEDICSAILTELGENELAGFGMAVPGAVDEKSIVHNCVNLGWGIVDLKEEVGKLLPEAPVLKFGNDATIAALGELWKGAGKNYSSAFMITLGTGVGGGYAYNGNIIYGSHGAAGEVGHIIINTKESTPCSCGRCGCAEQYASANGMVRIARNLMNVRDEKQSAASLHIERLFDLNVPSGPSGLDNIENFTTKDICALAKDGDPLCKCIIETFAKALGLTMSHISCTIDPDVFIVGGGLSKAGSIVLDPVKDEFRRLAFPASRDTEIIAAELGNDAGIYGCAAMVLK